MSKPSLKDFKKSGNSKNILEESSKLANALKKIKKEPTESFSKCISFHLTESEYEALEENMWKNRIKNRSAFVRDIIKKALDI